MEYTLVSGNSENFCERVNAHIQEGWQPLGGVAVESDPDPSGQIHNFSTEAYYHQAMVRTKAMARTIKADDLPIKP